jgi:hypothetical protein
VAKTSAQKKLARGIQQIKRLQREAKAFVDSEPYAFEIEPERRSPNEILYRCFAIERKAPPRNWPLLAGEAIQNVRSALDHAVWAAWRGVATNTGDGNHTQFPICDDQDSWKGKQWQLKGVPSPVRTVVKRAQPYERVPQAPKLAPLANLRTLSNTDKHRTLATFASIVWFETVGVSSGVTIDEWDVAAGKRLGKGKTPISSFLATSGSGVISEVNVKPSFTYDVGIEAMPLATLAQIVQVVFEILTEIETGARPHPFATYPL